jgi:hypothetical protein
MNHARKTAIAAALTIAMGTDAAVASPLFVNAGFQGSVSLLDPTGVVVDGFGPAVTGFMDWNFSTATGTASLIPSQPSFFGYYWTAHDITLYATAPNAVHADMLFDWGPCGNWPCNTHVTADFSIPVTGWFTYTLTTLDGDGDGVIGNAIDNGPFTGFNIVFAGSFYVDPMCIDGIDSNGNLVGYCNQAYPLAPAVVPLPPAIWLLGSGLGGLLGLSRGRKRGIMRHTQTR